MTVPVVAQLGSTVLPLSEVHSLQVGDVITAVNGTAVTDVNQFRLQIAGMAPGTNVSLKIARGGRDENVSLTLAEMKNQALGNKEDLEEQGLAPELFS